MSPARSPLPPAAPLSVPARPFDFALPPGRTALVVIDMQRDFIEPGGFGASLGNDVALLQAAIAPTLALLQAWRERGWPIVHTRESHAADLSDCPPSKRERGSPALRIGDAGPMGRLLVRGERGCEIVPLLAPLPGEIVIDKPGKGAFHATMLHAVLKSAGVTHLVVAGVTTEVCVQTTMREANDRGYDCLLVDEATASYFPHFKAATLEMVVAQGGIVGWVTQLDALLSALPPTLRESIRKVTDGVAPPSVEAGSAPDAGGPSVDAPPSPLDAAVAASAVPVMPTAMPLPPEPAGAAPEPLPAPPLRKPG